MPSSAANSAHESPLSRRLSTRFAHSSRVTRERVVVSLHDNVTPLAPLRHDADIDDRILIEEHSIRAGSGGGGRFRGGDGALRRVRFLEPMTAAILAGRRLVPPYGLTVVRVARLVEPRSSAPMALGRCSTTRSRRKCNRVTCSSSRHTVRGRIRHSDLTARCRCQLSST